MAPHPLTPLCAEVVHWTILAPVPAPPFVTVVEAPEFISRVEKLMSGPERDRLILYLSMNPAAGVVIPGTGGVRKLRWGLQGRGKRGGARIVYFYHNLDLPLFVLSVFVKNQRTDLSQDEKNRLRRVVNLIVTTYGRRKS